MATAVQNPMPNSEKGIEKRKYYINNIYPPNKSNTSRRLITDPSQLKIGSKYLIQNIFGPYILEDINDFNYVFRDIKTPGRPILYSTAIGNGIDFLEYTKVEEIVSGGGRRKASRKQRKGRKGRKATTRRR